MRKVFLDLGSNNGCSVRTFRRFYEDHKQYEIHCFEANPELWDHYDANLEWMRGVTLHKKAVGVADGTQTFYISQSHTSSTLEVDKDSGGGITEAEVEVIDFGRWVKQEFTIDDYIVMKMDIEGSEYEVLGKMFLDGSINYISDLYGELHATKMLRYPSPAEEREVNNNLLKKLEKSGLVMWEWYAYERESPSGKFERYRDLPLKYRKYNIL